MGAAKWIAAGVIALACHAGGDTEVTTPFRDFLVQATGNGLWVLNNPGGAASDGKGCLQSTAITRDFTSFEAIQLGACSPNVVYWAPEKTYLNCKFELGCYHSADAKTWHPVLNDTVLGVGRTNIYKLQVNGRIILAELRDTYGADSKLGYINSTSATEWNILVPDRRLNLSSSSSFSVEWSLLGDLFQFVQRGRDSSVKKFWYSDRDGAWQFTRTAILDAPAISQNMESQCGPSCFISVGTLPTGIQVSSNIKDWNPLPNPYNVFPTGVCCQGVTCYVTTKQGTLYSISARDGSVWTPVLETGLGTFATCEDNRAVVMLLGGRLLLQFTPQVSVLANNTDPFTGYAVKKVASADAQGGPAQLTVLAELPDFIPPWGGTPVAFQRAPGTAGQWRQVDVEGLRVWDKFVPCSLLPADVRGGSSGACYYNIDSDNVLRFRSVPGLAIHLATQISSVHHIRFMSVVDGKYYFVGNTTNRNSLFFSFEGQLQPGGASNILILEHDLDRTAEYMCSNGTALLVGLANYSDPAYPSYKQAVSPLYLMNTTGWKRMRYIPYGDDCGVISHGVFLTYHWTGDYTVLDDLAGRYHSCHPTYKVQVTPYVTQKSVEIVALEIDGLLYSFTYDPSIRCEKLERLTAALPTLNPDRLAFAVGEDGSTWGSNGEIVFRVG